MERRTFVGEDDGTAFTHIIASAFSSLMSPQIYIPRPKLHSLSCYFPTSWEDDASVDGMYELLTAVLEKMKTEGGPIMIGRDFNLPWWCATW